MMNNEEVGRLVTATLVAPETDLHVMLRRVDKALERLDLFPPVALVHLLRQDLTVIKAGLRTQQRLTEERDRQRAKRKGRAA